MKEPRKIFSRSETDITELITRNAMPRLKVAPESTSVVLIPEATPLSSGGTELMIEALLGDAKIPMPLPTNTRGGSSCRNVTVVPICASKRKPIDETTRPRTAKKR